MLSTRTLRTSSLVLVGSLLTGGISFGQLTLLDQQPSQTFSLYAHVNLEATADQFVVSDPAGVRVTDFTIWGTWNNGGMSNNDTFDVIFHENAVGGPPFNYDEPGTVIASVAGLAPTVTATGLTMPSFGGPTLPEYKLDFVLPTSVQVPTGIIWIEMYSTGSSGTGEGFAWGMAPQDTTNGDLYMSWSATTPGVAWNTNTPLPATDMAIVVNGLPADPGTAYCPGNASCPCGNNNDGSMGGCDWGNASFPGGGVLRATGSNSIGAADTFLHADGVENNFGVFFEADNQVNGGAGNPLNDGLRCAGGALVRLTSPTPAVGNSASTPAAIQTLGSTAVAGSPKRYQYWFRTPNGPCAQTANLTNGYEIVWTP